MKTINKIRLFFLPSIILLHVLLIFLRGYFLSIEFTLYPFLRSHGFLPYQDIIDQHFPTLMFGPFSLPAFLTANPWPLLAVFLLVLCLTDLILYATLIRFGVKLSLVWVVLYILSSVYFSGNVLWLETFVNLLLVSWLFLSFSKRSVTSLVSGLILSQIILMRPTIFPAILLIFLGLSLPFSLSLMAGFLLGLLIPGGYLVRFGLWDHFFRLALDFNGRVYPLAAGLKPSLRNMLTLGLWLAPATYTLLKNKKTFLVLSLLAFFALIVPRFGYEHLQPLFLSTVIFWAIQAKKPTIFVYLYIVLLFLINLISAVRHPYGNYFLTPEVVRTSQWVKKLPGNTIYLLGASDIIYPLSGKYPPNFTYLPSLPWYLSQKDFTDKVINSLTGGYTPVLVDYDAMVDGRNVVESSGPILEYIKMNYTEGGAIENYVLYYPKQ